MISLTSRRPIPAPVCVSNLGPFLHLHFALICCLQSCTPTVLLPAACICTSRDKLQCLTTPGFSSVCRIQSCWALYNLQPRIASRPTHYDETHHHDPLDTHTASCSLLPHEALLRTAFRFLVSFIRYASKACECIHDESSTMIKSRFDISGL